MRHKIATALLAPILLRQGRQVREQVVLLPEPTGDRQGVAGEGSPMRVLIIGDSAGAGVGATSQTEALSGRLVTALATRHTVHWRLIARSGATAGQTIRRLRRLDDEPWDWVVVSLGVWADSQPDCARLATEFSHDPNLMASDGFHPGPGLYRLWGQAVADHILAQSEAPVSAGWCEQCHVEHRLEQGPALAHALGLMRDLEQHKRIDFDTTKSDPRLATDYLFGPARGQMFGVLVGEDSQGQTVVLRAFSCQYNGIWQVAGWAPPLFPLAAYEKIMMPGDRQLKDLGQQLADLPAENDEAKDLKQQRKQLSQVLMKELHALYEVRNSKGEIRPMAEFFTHAKGIPTGAGDCCAPKLLNQAVQMSLRPLGLAEFYWGAANRSATREHGCFYGSCTDKCQPLLGYMLCGGEA